MIEFFNRLFRRAGSSETAKERLRLVLLSDHLQLAPDVIESLKRDLLEVISKYVEVDTPNCEVTFEHQERQIAMLANVPIVSLKARRIEPSADEASQPAAPAPRKPRAARRRKAAAPATES